MGPRSAIVLGLLSGVLVVALLVVAGAAYLPDMRARPATPTAPAITSGASSSPTVSPRPSASGSASGSAVAPSASPSAAATPTPDAVVTNFHVGKPAPPLAVPQLGGGTIELEQLKGKPVWITFMATWCPSCVDELPQMNGFYVRYADEGLVVVAVDVLEDDAVAAEFMNSLNVRFPVGLDRDGSARDAWQALALPVHYWIDAEGVVRDGALGGIGPDFMARALQRIMPDVEISL